MSSLAFTLAAFALLALDASNRLDDERDVASKLANQ